MLRGVVYRLIEYLASMGHSSIWKLICAISVNNILTVGVHLPSTPSISGPGSATDFGGKRNFSEHHCMSGVCGIEHYICDDLVVFKL